MMFEVNVGQEVGYGKFHWGTLLYAGAARVTKIDRYGHIELENGKRFNKRGEALPARGMTYTDGAYLIPIDRYREAVAELEALRVRVHLTNEITAVLSQHRAHAMSDETRARVQDMLARMP